MTRIRNATRATLVMVLLLASATISVGQPPPAALSPKERSRSHVPIPNDKLASDLSSWLRGQNRSEVKNPFDSEMFRSLLPDLNDPRELAKWIDKNPDLLNSSYRKQFESYLRDYLERNPNDPKFGHIDPEKFAQQLHEVRPPKIDPPVEVENPHPSTMPFRPSPRPTERSPEPPDPNSRTGELSRWFRENLGDSPAVKNMIKDLAYKFGEGDGGNRPSWLPEFKGEGGGFGKWAERNLGFLKDVKVPDFKMSNVKLPSFGSGGHASSGGGGWGSLSAPSGGGSWAGLIILVLLAAAGLAVWIILIQFRGRSAGAKQAHRARNWPVDPALISTREELVQAFDYLSLTHCGEEARTWNHRVIAGEMGAQGPPQKDAAGALAGLYEHARYAPLDESMTELQYAEARRQFRVLGGESPA